MAAVLDLAAAVDAVVGRDLDGCSLEQLQEQYAAVAREVQRLTGLSAALLAELQARGGGQLPTDDGRPRSLAGWAAEASGDSPSASGRAVRVAAALQRALPGVTSAVLDGRLPYVRAEVLARLVGHIDEAALREAEPDLVLTAQVMDPVQLAAYVRHLLATWVEPVLDEAESRAEQRRYLRTRTEHDGSVWGSFLLPAGQAEAVLTAIEPLARREGDVDARSAAQRRADALTEVCEQVLRHGDLPEAGGSRPQLSYVVPADWAAQRVQEQACTACSRCPQHTAAFADLVAAGVQPEQPGQAGQAKQAEQTGQAGSPPRHACAVAAWTGPQTRGRAEALLCDARITRVLLDGHGQVASLSALGDEVTRAQRRALAARDRGCAARGCTRPPAMCDAHHLVARADAGPTTLANLVLLCRRHHVLWHLGRITYEDLHVPWTTAATANGPPTAA